MLTKTLPFTFAFLWSTGFIGAKYGLPYIEPYSFLAIRLAITLVILFMIIVILKPVFPNRQRTYIDIFISGVLIHAAYLGGVFTAIKLGLPAGITAVIVGLQPIITIVYAHGFKSPMALLTSAFGFIGLILIVTDSNLLLGIGLEPLLPCLLALVGITFGTIYQKQRCSETHIIVIAFLQYIPSLLIFGALAYSFESEQTIIWSSELIYALLWLSIILSIGAILLMSLLYKHNSASIAANYFYLAPPFALLQAYFFFDERINMLKLVGIALVVVSIYLTGNIKEKR